MTATPRQMLEGFHQAMLHMSADELADLFAADAQYEFPFLTPSRPESYRGREEIRAGFHRVWDVVPVRVDEIRAVVVHETADPEVIVTEQEVAATLTTTGVGFVRPSLLVMRVREGEIVHLRDYSDSLRGAMQLGQLPALVERLAREGS
jgi:ketosteroid isomerase-like protein